MKLLDLYRAMLTLGNMTADEDGFISGSIAGMTEEVPVTIKGLRMVLPTSKQLRSGNWEHPDRVVFHPLYENVMRGESKVLEKYRNLIMTRINFIIGVVGTGMLTLAASNARHAELNPEQSKFLRITKNIDEKTLDVFGKLLDAASVADVKSQPLSLYLKRSGTVAGKKYSRVGVVAFPIYEELMKDGPAFGIKLRQRDREVIKGFFEYVFPHIADVGAYNRGSDSPIAPFTDALIRTTASVAAPLNDVIEMFKNVVDDISDLQIEMDWLPYFDTLETFQKEIRAIPMQPGNEGTPINKGVAPVETAAPATVQETAKVQQNDVSGHHAIPMSTVTAAITHPPVQHTQQQQPVARTERGLDFGSLIRSNPAYGPQYQSGPTNQAMLNRNMPSRFDAPQGWGHQQQNWNQQQQGNWGGGGGYPVTGRAII